MKEILMANARSKFIQLAEVRAFTAEDVQPTNPPTFISAGPKCRIAGPKAADIAGTPPLFERIFDRFAKLGRHLEGLAVDCVAKKGGAFARQRAEQLVERVSELLYPFVSQLRRHSVDRNTAIGKCTHRSFGAIDVLF